MSIKIPKGSIGIDSNLLKRAREAYAQMSTKERARMNAMQMASYIIAETAMIVHDGEGSKHGAIRSLELIDEILQGNEEASRQLPQFAEDLVFLSLEDKQGLRGRVAKAIAGLEEVPTEH